MNILIEGSVDRLVFVVRVCVISRGDVEQSTIARVTAGVWVISFRSCVILNTQLL